MPLNRRQFLTGAAAIAGGVRASDDLLAAPAFGLGAAARASFPWAGRETYLNSAAYHPISLHSAHAMREYVGYRLNGAPWELDDAGASGRGSGGARQEAVKRLFGALINAAPDEVAFVQSTSDGESVVVAGMDLEGGGGNVVIDDLHYPGSIYMYRRLEERGLEVRMVRHRDWGIDVADMERAIDGDTRLVSMALVSNVNGFLHDVKAISDLAHARGAYVYADVIQAAGAVPMDVKAMGLDFCACSSYKWLMGSRGFGFLYVKAELQETVVRPTRFGHRQYRSFDPADQGWDARPGAYRYETGNVSNVGAAGVHEALRYILRVGVPNIRAHVRPLTDRLQQELPALGYPSITPIGTDTPIVSFRVSDPAGTAARLRQAGVAVTVLASAGRMRISPSIFNTQADVDRLLETLAST